MYQEDLSTFSDGLLRVRGRFIHDLEEKRRRLVQLRFQAQDDRQSLPASKEIGQICHKIAGTAATLGFPTLGEHALAIDDAVDQKAAEISMPSHKLLLTVDTLVSEIERIQATAT